MTGAQRLALLASGHLVQVPPQYRTPGADIYAVYAQRHQLSSRIRVFVDCLSDAFARLGNKSGPGSAGIA